MRWAQLGKKVFDWLRPGLKSGHSGLTGRRGPLTHVIVLDGTMSSLAPGCETNAGLAYRLLSEVGAPLSVYYEAGVQWCDWRTTPDVLMGRGINRQIRRAYGYLASRYRPGDRIFLLGYSRGAYAVRSLAGVIDQVGLLRAECATERNVMQAYRYYQTTPKGQYSADFARANCHEKVEIEMIGAWDTVKALGMRLPILWRWAEVAHSFHNHHLGPSIKRGFHALALNETREVFEPVLWQCPPDWNGRIEQVWFAGAHGDVGGQLGSFHDARPLSNIPLVWILEKAEECGLDLPEGWRGRFPTNPRAPSVGTWRGVGKLFLLRRKRVVGSDPSESLHESVAERDESLTDLMTHTA